MKKCSKDHSLSDPGIFNDPHLLGFAPVIFQRLETIKQAQEKLIPGTASLLKDLCDYHDVFGLHFEGNGWIFREWAPNASEVYILCEKTSWHKDEAFRLTKKSKGVFERFFEKETFTHQDLFRLHVQWPGGEGDRIPTAAERVVQDPITLIFNAQVWHPEIPYIWKNHKFTPSNDTLLIYETHVGMALEDGRIGSFKEFEDHILPKIKDAGYNCIQFMAIQEHPYYASFGYHVSSFFAASSRFGTPDELKSLIDRAHGYNIRVLMDIIHSHAVNNEVEGISCFDGTHHQFFHKGDRGHHLHWDSRCFDYGKKEVLVFLLSN
ncbi:MAG: 1,4-alpha-glucan-branching enzyme, partial [Desulfobacteraceae bacterium]|nr:1,4-alpha-glucan-branching enzyme [Desulfobacteraceae bacterium]